MKEDRSETSIFDVIKDKVFFSCFSNEMAIVVDEIPEEREGGKVYFDGMTLIDDVEDVEDDIQQVYSYTEYGKKVNLEDYYQENGVFNEDRSRLIEAIGDW